MPRHSTRPRSAPRRDVPVVADLPAVQRARRDRIVAAAVATLVAEGYDGVSMKAVADEAGVALGTLYRYFASKDHLLACALLAWASGFDRAPGPPPDATPTDRVTAVYRRAARAFERQPRVHDALMQLQASRDPDAAAVYAEFSRRQLSAFASALDGFDDPDRDDVVDIMNAVLAEALRACEAGTITRAEVLRRIDRAAELLTAGRGPR